MANSKRDNFSPKTRLQIAKRAGWLCSYPPCRESTVGATSDGNGEIDLGEACHITAAAPGGPRYDENISPQDRTSPKNGIWMCRLHARAIDSTDPQFTVELLHEWKRQAERESWQRVLRIEQALTHLVTTGVGLDARFQAAAAADLDVFRQTVRWPPTQVELMLTMKGFDEPIRTRALAEAAVTLDDLVLVAQPGMGKTTTLFQIAEGILARNVGGPIFVPLGDWAVGTSTILESVLRRPAFQGISENDFRTVTAKPGVVLLLDGWNELDSSARKRASVQVSNLQAELPELGLVVSTRRQVLDLPFTGTKIDLMPLNEVQQEQIAVAMRSDSGRRIIDQAWRTAGLRELITIPLYLRALLSLPEGEPFPVTKEEVLRQFVDAHEGQSLAAENLYGVTRGFQQDYLADLAVLGTAMAGSAIADGAARPTISRTAGTLIESGDITNPPEPNDILDVLVSSHLLTRVGEPTGYAFQHQQFQEWYASHVVERRILVEVDDPSDRQKLKAEVLNNYGWEEPVLFAVERLARGNNEQRSACGKAILAAFEVDPVLAAEMIFRSTDEVWQQISGEVLAMVNRWHQAGTVDRAVRFMLTSGRAEFLDQVWPLITHENEQISLDALRNSARFRPSILGADAAEKIKSLPVRPRTVVLHEIASRSGIDGMDLASEIAKEDPDPDVQAMVIRAFAFRRADRHVEVVLREAPDRTYELIAGEKIIQEPVDERIREKLAAALHQKEGGQDSAYKHLSSIVYARGNEDHSAEVATIIAEAAFGPNQMQIIDVARQRYAASVAEGLLARVRAGLPLFHGADNILASSSIRLDDDDIFEIAISDLDRQDVRMDAAASILGPTTAGFIFPTRSMASLCRRKDRRANTSVRRFEGGLKNMPG